MRIAQVSAAMDIGGAERMLVELAKSHARDGLEIVIMAPPGVLDRDWAKDGIGRFRFPQADRNPIDLIRAARSVGAGVRAFGPDVIHAHNVKATLFALAGARTASRRVPVLATFHGVPARQMWAATQILRLADMTVAVSDALKESLVTNGLRPDRVEVVHNGVAAGPELSATARAEYDRELNVNGAVVAAVGRLAAQKAHYRFLNAAAIVLQSRPSTTFLVVGDGRLRDALREQAAELGIGHAIRFTGSRGDARDLIARADLLVFSSNWEGLSIAALEALAAGTPVVSTDVAGMRELLGSGAGTIVRSWEPRELAAAVVTLLDDDALRLRMADAGRRLVADRFSMSVMEDRYAELYARLAR
jgi:glycosyltransferase involved in cell wall biosynthesis